MTDIYDRAIDALGADEAVQLLAFICRTHETLITTIAGPAHVPKLHARLEGLVAQIESAKARVGDSRQDVRTLVERAVAAGEEAALVEVR